MTKKILKNEDVPQFELTVIHIVDVPSLPPNCTKLVNFLLCEILLKTRTT